MQWLLLTRVPERRQIIIRDVGAIISSTESSAGSIDGASITGRGRMIFAFSITSPHLPSGFH